MFEHVKMPYSRLLSGHVMHPGMNNTACIAISKISHRWVSHRGPYSYLEQLATHSWASDQFLL